MHFSDVGKEKGATKEKKVHMENRKISGGRKREKLLSEKYRA